VSLKRREDGKPVRVGIQSQSAVSRKKALRFSDCIDIPISIKIARMNPNFRLILARSVSIMIAGVISASSLAQNAKPRIAESDVVQLANNEIGHAGYNLNRDFGNRVVAYHPENHEWRVVYWGNSVRNVGVYIDDLTAKARIVKNPPRNP
jgi:hypothetical protein